MTAPAQVDALLNDGTHELPSMNRDFHSGTALPRIAVLIPCYNEAAAIATVIADFQRALPTATIYVYDNNSSDDTVKVAAQAGAIVRAEPLQGKGNVVRRMFADIEAEVYVLVDGDGTYDASAAERMVRLLLEDSLDLVNAARVPVTELAYRPGHKLGNKLLTGTVAMIFGNRIRDMLSGYRVLVASVRQVVPRARDGLRNRDGADGACTRAAVTDRGDRNPLPGSPTRLAEQAAHVRRRVQDPANDCHVGERGTATAVLLAKRSVAGDDIGDCSHGRCSPNYLATGLVPRLPTAVLVTGLMVLAFMSVVAGLVLDTVTLGRRELKRLHYLALRGPTERRRSNSVAPWISRPMLKSAANWCHLQPSGSSASPPTPRFFFS